MRHSLASLGSVIVLALSVFALPAVALDLSVPLSCELGRECFVQNYVDIDPSDTVLTADCGKASYDGHKGTDFRVLNTRVTMEVLAAAPGRVKALRNDMPDRLVRKKEDRAAVRDRECGNGVVIAHEGGWETQYCHLRQGSVSVSVGDEVERGQMIGSVGFSGFAAFPHVHLAVRKDGQVVDPFLGSVAGAQDRLAACSASAVALPQGGSLWAEDADMLLRDAGGALVEMGFAGKPVRSQDLETGSVMTPATDAPALVFFARLINLKEGDRIDLELTGPNGVVTISEGKPLERNKAQWVAFAGRKTPQGGWPAGAYAGEVVLRRGGRELLRRNTRIDLGN